MRRYIPLILLCVFAAALPWLIAQPPENPAPETTSTTQPPSTSVPATSTTIPAPTTTSSTTSTTSSTASTTSSTTTLFTCPSGSRQETVDGRGDCVPKSCFIDVPFRRQEEASWCGPAVVQMVSEYWGVSRTQANLARGLKTEDTTGIGMVSRLFRDFDFKVNVTSEGDPQEKLERLLYTVCVRKTPVVVLQRLTVNDTTYGHYRIVAGYEPGRVFVVDPIMGLTAYSVQDFYLLWRSNAQVESDNVALTPTPA